MSRLDVRLERLEKEAGIINSDTPLFDLDVAERMRQAWIDMGDTEIADQTH